MHLPKFACVWWWSVLLLQAQFISITWSRGAAGGVDGASLPVLKIGALLGINSSIGQVALASIQLAVQDVNSNASILPDYELSLEALDSACDPFQGAVSAVELLKDEVVAVAGPQTSTVAQFVVALGSATQVPIVSFSATDPSLTEANNPYFLRTVHNGKAEMTVIASLIELYGWREVAAVSTNDYVGVDTLDALAEALYNSNINFLYRTNISPNANVTDVVNVLNELVLLEARVFVINLQLNLGRLFFNTAQSLGMVATGYVWLISESMGSVLEYLPTTDSIWAATQGVVAFRSYIPPSPELNSFQQRLRSRLASDYSGGAAIPSSIYGLYAYDTVWMIARAIQTFVGSGHNFTFIPRNTTAASQKGSSELASLNVFKEGNVFLNTLKDTQFVGVSGPVQVDSHGDLVGASYEILNLIGKSPRVVGYWNQDWGFSLLPSSSSNGSFNGSSTFTEVATQNTTTLQDVIWPGGMAQVPRGWAVVKNGQKLRIGVPVKTGFPQFVDISTDKTSYNGFCINVFETAISYLPYAVNYTYVPFGNGTSSPNYDDLVEMIPEGNFDGVVGDVTITMDRSKIVDFTQPYTASGLVVVVPTEVGGSSHAWSFLRPFTPLMWATTGLFFLFTGLAIWILEHKKNKDFRGNPKKQVVTVLWFIFSTLFFSQREKTKSTLGRAVLIIWLFVVLIVISSYTASLTSILTVQQLIPTIQGIAGLVSSDVNIGYQAGSFVESYLEQMSVPASRLIPLRDQTAYATALSKGTVGAIVDELPYIDVFLNNNCQFTIAGQEFTKSGWGFAFPKGSQLAVDISTAILQMAENGRLQQIHDFWVNTQNCGSGLTVSSNKLGIDTFWALFVISGAASVLCVLIYYSRLIWQHHKNYKPDDEDSDRSISRSLGRKSFLRSLVSYIEEAEVKTRDDSAKAKKSSRKYSRGRRNSETGMESAGCSARSGDPVLSAARTPDHPI